MPSWGRQHRWECFIVTNGLDDSESGTDLRGIYLPPADLHWSLYGVPEQLENDDTLGHTSTQ